MVKKIAMCAAMAIGLPILIAAELAMLGVGLWMIWALIQIAAGGK